MNVLIPLAGKDREFEEQGLPKSLTLVGGKPIIQIIAESRPFSYKKAIFVILAEHKEKHWIDKRLKELFGDEIRLVVADKLTEGAPQSCLLARDMIDNEEPLLIDLADQYLDLPGFMDFIQDTKARGVIPTFESFYPNRGYMTYKDGKIEAISEKDPQPISTHSTACVSFFKEGSDFVESADAMIAKKRVAANDAYLISLVYNEMIESGKKVLPFDCEFIATLGTLSGAASFEQLARPLKSSKDVFKQRISEYPVFLHRGKRPRPENSLTSINIAMNWGFSVEIDVRKSKDGEYILSHDDELSRTIESKALISKSTAKDLMKYHFKATDEGLATLDSALDQISKRAYGVLAIHVKDNATKEVVLPICKMILSRRLESRVFLFGDGANSMPVHRIVKEAYPVVNTGVHIEAEAFGSMRLPADADVYWVDEKKKVITSAIRAAAKKAGALSIAMSPELINPKVNKKDASKRCDEFFAMGFDGVCTDYF
jgi:glycerophosphoryl diester phosphodiesterase/dTDP-glucose pyrophosphorylase